MHDDAGVVACLGLSCQVGFNNSRCLIKLEETSSALNAVLLRVFVVAYVTDD
jgi:hypothetical protein